MPRARPRGPRRAAACAALAALAAPAAPPRVAVAMAGQPSPPRPPRVLCLHGKGHTGEAFRQNIKALEDLGQLELVSPDAAHPLGGGFAWWLLPPGERSFTTPRFDGWSGTLAHVQRLWSEQGPFDAVFGFSQGAILLAALAAIGALPAAAAGAPRAGGAGGAEAVQALSPEPRALVLVGAAVPGPFRRELEALGAATAAAVGAADAGVAAGPRILHVVGRCDDINPPEGGREVAAALGGEVYEHPGGHEVPLDGASLGRYRAFLAAAGVPLAAAPAAAPPAG